MAENSQSTEVAEAPRPVTTAVSMPKVNLKGGASVAAIIPTTIEEVWQIARMAVNGAMAPDSLVKEKGGAWKPLEDAISACAIAIMAGAEMGLTPLTALRSYAVVNGRPTLWGDGIKAVVRQSGLCVYIKTGSDATMGWCESQRRDTGEIVRKEFTLVQATKAKLTAKKGPWQDYTDSMLERRATFRCLNDLYADVLAGIVAAEEAEDYTDLGTPSAPSRPITRSEPPDPPAQPEPELHNSDQLAGAENEVATAADGSLNFGTDPTEEALAELEAALAEATNDDEVETIFDSSDIQLSVAGNDDALARAFEIRRLASDRVNRAAAINGGQGDLLGE